MSSNSSGNASFQGGSPSVLRGVEQLIESDQQEKNNKKIETLKNQFPVLKRIHPFYTNTEKLQIFLHDPNFKNRVIDKLMENGMLLNEYAPITKAYLVSTRYGAPVSEQFDEHDIQLVFQRFGQIYQFQIFRHIAYIWFHLPISSYLAVKALNGLQVSEWLRLSIKFCNEEEMLEAHTLFFNKNNCKLNHSYFNQLNLSNKPSLPSGRKLDNNNKFIAKYQLGVDNLPQFNFDQRLIGPRGSYMKKIIQKVLQGQPNFGKFTINNIDKILKIKFMPKSSSSNLEFEEKSHIFISSRQKVLYEGSCKEIEALLKKVFQEYKIAFQKMYHRHPQGFAYKLYEFHNSEFIEIRHVNIQQIENIVDLVGLSNQPKLSSKVIEEKIEEREKARRLGRYHEADRIRNWLKGKGVMIIDSKRKGQKSSWHYIV